jgi:hypothetical protein
VKRSTKPLTIKEMKALAKSRGGRCLSDKYINNYTNLEWECKEGHRWEAPPRSIKAGRWCARCGHTHVTIKNMQELAKCKGGKCLSTEYLNTNSKLKWQCRHKHTWEAAPANVKKGTWCPHCAKNMPLTLEELQNVAISRGGKCLGKQYVNAQSKISWECSKGHQWKATPANIRQGNWCHQCRKLTIELMQEIAEERGGKCLSKVYKNIRHPLSWECAKGHRWDTTPSSIRQGTWCPECARKRRRKQ